MNNSFALDKSNGKLMGVCAGLARSAGADATLIRLLVAASVLVFGGLTIPLYVLAGLIAPAR